jgi:hypothetical protein
MLHFCLTFIAMLKIEIAGGTKPTVGNRVKRQLDT